MVPIMCNIILLANANYPLTNETHIYGFHLWKETFFLEIWQTRFMSSSKLMQKCKVFPVHTMKAYMGRRGTTPLILNLGTRCRQVVNFMPWPCTPRKEPWYLLNRRLGKPQSQSGHFLSLPGFKPKPTSLNQLHCSSFFQVAKSPQEFKQVKCRLWPANLTRLLYVLHSQICSHRLWYLWYMQSFRGTNQRQYWR
jgi:hypothetical protein